MINDRTNDLGGDGGVASAVHGAVALLHSLHTERSAQPVALASWSAVYGATTLEPDLEDLQREFQARRPRTIPDAFMAGAAAMGDVLSEPTSLLVTQQLTAHIRIENELLRRLAEVTGSSVPDVLTSLDLWAADHDE